MDYIKRKICLEGARTRTQGLMPYYEFGKTYEQHVVSGSSCYTIDELELEVASGFNGNWGQFVANPCFLANEGKTYETMLRNYYSILNMVRSGVKLRKVKTKDGGAIFTEDIGGFTFGDCPSGGTGFIGGDEPDYLYDYAAYDAKDFYSQGIDSVREETKRIYRSKHNILNTYIVLIEDYDKFTGLSKYLSGTAYKTDLVKLNPVDVYSGDPHYEWERYCEVVDLCIGKINIPSRIYNEHIKVPKSMPCADVKPYIDWLSNYQTLSADCCNTRLWEDMGGEEMLEYLEVSAKTKCESYGSVINGLKYAVPYIEIPLLIRQNYTDVGVLTNIDGVEYDETISGAVRSNNTRPHGYMSANTEYEECGLTEYDIALLVHSGVGLCIDQIVMGSKINEHPTTEEYETNPSDYTDESGFTKYPIEVESLLWTLRDKKKYTDDKDNVLPGLFQKFSNPAGQMYACVKISGGTWEMKPLKQKPADCKNGDGLESVVVLYGDNGNQNDKGRWKTAKDKYYRTITTCEAGIQIAKTREIEANEEDEPNAHYFFMAKYDNSPESPMTIPYEKGNTANVYLVHSGTSGGTDWVYRGDFIDTISSGNSVFEATYVIGGYYSGDSGGNFISAVTGTGDIYREKYTLQEKHVDYVALDGVDNVPVYSDYIDFDGAAKEFYSPRYGLYRTGNTANIISATSGEFWVKKDDGSYANDAYLAKEEYLTAFSLPPKVDVNVTIDRGGASAFEKHYKLSECNTMQDLTNYGNNFFNI